VTISKEELRVKIKNAKEKYYNNGYTFREFLIEFKKHRKLGVL